MDKVLGGLPRVVNEDVLVGFDKADDAGVYRLNDDLALVQTADFFTPIVDDPYTFGQIAAANSLSDVYAMGGKPLSALCLTAFPQEGDIAVLERIVRGGWDKMQEAGCAVIGGHSIYDPEIKFGYSVTGTIAPKRILSNAGAKPGDSLVMTKRLGTGILSTALKRGAVSEAQMAEAIQSMCALNKGPAEIATRFQTHALTDITGFGLLGHAREMAIASGVGLEIQHFALEFFPGAREAARDGHQPGGLSRNRDFISCAVEWRVPVPPEVEALMYDPQTSGGLLIAVDSAQSRPLMVILRDLGANPVLIGRVTANPKPPIVVV